MMQFVEGETIIYIIAAIINSLFSSTGSINFLLQSLQRLQKLISLCNIEWLLCSLSVALC